MRWCFRLIFLSAVCATSCLADRAYCTIPGGCDCNQQWDGTLCDGCSIGFTGADCSNRLFIAKQWTRFKTHLLLPAATCLSGCGGSCYLPGECYCNFGYSGPYCNISTPLSKKRNTYSGLGVCTFTDVNVLCLKGMCQFPM